MPRGKKGQYALETDGDGRLTPARVDGGDSSVQRLPGLPESAARAEAAGLAFLDIIYREDGWLRVVGGELNKSCYWKFKFSSGQHKGKYVMYVSLPGQWEEGLCGLADKLRAVDRGELKPAHDTFYDPR